MEHLQVVRAQAQHYDAYYQIRSEEKNLYWTGYRRAPDYDEFRQWFEGRLSDPDRHIYMLMQKGDGIGSLHLDYEHRHVGVGYNILNNFEGRGLGTYLLFEALKIARQAKVERPNLVSMKAWIFIENEASARVAEKNGFHRQEQLVEKIRLGQPAKFYVYERTV